MDGKQILDLPMGTNDAEASTIRGYLKCLLTTLWKEGESFSGKRPLGNSGWEHELYVPLIAAGVVKGKLDSDGYTVDLDRKAADKAIMLAIEALE